MVSRLSKNTELSLHKLYVLPVMNRGRWIKIVVSVSKCDEAKLLNFMHFYKVGLHEFIRIRTCRWNVLQKWSLSRIIRVKKIFSSKFGVSKSIEVLQYHWRVPCTHWFSFLDKTKVFVFFDNFAINSFHPVMQICTYISVFLIKVIFFECTWHNLE